MTKRQRIRDLMKHPEQEALLAETYDELEADLQKKIEGLNHQIDMLANKRNTILAVNRSARTALEVFADILQKEHLERADLELMIRNIRVFEDHLEIELQSDIDAILHAAPREDAVNFKGGMEHSANVTVIQSAAKRPDKVFHANVISDGDPLEIFTDKDGGVIFKKYSLMGGVVDFAGQLCETLNRTTGKLTVITDRDSCIAVAGVPRRELMDKAISHQLERLMEGRQIYQYKPGETAVPLCADSDKYAISIAAPILSEGDVLGCVLFAGSPDQLGGGEVEYKLAQSIAAFLGRHMES